MLCIYENQACGKSTWDVEHKKEFITIKCERTPKIVCICEENNTRNIKKLAREQCILCSFHKIFVRFLSEDLHFEGAMNEKFKR